MDIIDINSKIIDLIKDLEYKLGNEWYPINEIICSVTLDNILNPNNIKNIRKKYVPTMEYIEIKHTDLLKFYCNNYQVYLSIDNCEKYVKFGDRKHNYQDMLDDDKCRYFIAKKDAEYVVAYSDEGFYNEN